MKKLILILCFALSTTISSKAQLLTESFDYPAGDSLQQHGWVPFSGTANGLFVTTPGLDYAGYQLPGIGNATSLVNTGQDSYKQLSSNQSSGNVYSFFIVKVDTARILNGVGDFFLRISAIN
ncbi:MAG: hypothetical protein IPL53_13135 [Ignavibacteria bacterium]|nr:hypothetical protein [Ignavibacteria bacterium]